MEEKNGYFPIDGCISLAFFFLNFKTKKTNNNSFSHYKLLTKIFQFFFICFFFFQTFFFAIFPILVTSNNYRQLIIKKDNSYFVQLSFLKTNIKLIVWFYKLFCNLFFFIFLHSLNFPLFLFDCLLLRLHLCLHHFFVLLSVYPPYQFMVRKKNKIKFFFKTKSILEKNFFWRRRKDVKALFINQ